MSPHRPLLPPQPHCGSFSFQGCPVVERPSEPQVSTGPAPREAAGPGWPWDRAHPAVSPGADLRGRGFPGPQVHHQPRHLRPEAPARAGAAHRGLPAHPGWLVSGVGRAERPASQLEQAGKVMVTPGKGLGGAAQGRGMTTGSLGERVALEQHGRCPWVLACGNPLETSLPTSACAAAGSATRRRASAATSTCWRKGSTRTGGSGAATARSWCPYG